MLSLIENNEACGHPNKTAKMITQDYNNVAKNWFGAHIIFSGLGELLWCYYMSAQQII